MVLSIVWSFLVASAHSGAVITYFCYSNDCSGPCESVTSYVDLENNCVDGEKNRCINGILGYSLYDSKTCEGEPKQVYDGKREGVCHRLFVDDSYYFKCHHELRSNSDANTNTDNVNWFMYLIEAICILLVFVVGLFGGYWIYKKRCCRERKYANVEEIMQNGQLLDA